MINLSGGTGGIYECLSKLNLYDGMYGTLAKTELEDDSADVNKLPSPSPLPPIPSKEEQEMKRQSRSFLADDSSQQGCGDAKTQSQSVLASLGTKQAFFPARYLLTGAF